MLQPTDRVLAKILARVLRDVIQAITSNTMEGAMLLTEVTLPYVTGNPALVDALRAILGEVGAEARAEERGDAVPYPTNAPQPATEGF